MSVAGGPLSTKVTRTTVTIVTAIVLAILTFAVNRQSAEENSGTFDESIYMFLGWQQQQHPDAGALAALGVAPLPVRAIWTRAVLDPVTSQPYDPGVFRQRLARARQNAIVLFAIPLVVGTFFWIAARHGLIAGSVTALTLALSPNLIAHASLATTDVAFAAIFVGTVAALTAYFEQQSWPRAGVVALAIGTALATKYSGVGFFVVMAAAAIMYRHGRRWRVDVAVIAGAIVIAWAWHGWATAPLFVEGGRATSLLKGAFSWTASGDAIAASLARLPAPIIVRGIATQAYLDSEGQKAFLLGHVSQFGWWYFFPVALTMKATIAELLAVGAFLVMAFRRKIRDPEWTVAICAVAIFFGLAMLSRRDLGFRYVLAPFVLAVTMGVVWALERWRQPRPQLAMAAAVVGMQALAFAGIAPQHLAHVNPLAGGPARGYTKLVDSNLDWGQDLIRLSEWLGRHEGDRVGIAYFGLAPFSAYGVTVADWRTLADGPPQDAREVFVISATYLQGVFLCGDPFAKLRAIEPIDRIGYSLLAYDARQDDVRRILREAAADPCHP